MSFVPTGRGQVLRTAGIITILSLRMTIALPAETAPPPVSVPDALVFEVITAPGYDWMETVCVQADEMPVTDTMEERPSRDGAEGTDHDAHHPEPTQTTLFEPGWLESTIGELNSTVKALESFDVTQEPFLGSEEPDRPRSLR